MMIVKKETVKKLLYWLFSILFPTINAQVIITYLLAKKSRTCHTWRSDNGGQFDLSFMKPIGDDTIAWNWVILFAQVLVLLLLLIIMDCGLLRFSCSCLYKSFFNENTLDDDVRAERHRIFDSHERLIHRNRASTADGNEEDHETDHLIVHDLVKEFYGRPRPAVNHLTFGARRGEAFGLLGYNVSAACLIGVMRMDHRTAWLGRW